MLSSLFVNLFYFFNFNSKFQKTSFIPEGQFRHKKSPKVGASSNRLTLSHSKLVSIKRGCKCLANVEEFKAGRKCAFLHISTHSHQATVFAQ